MGNKNVDDCDEASTTKMHETERARHTHTLRQGW